jgi:uncharacterized SAM-binding protein YcdF (DUF218 family)
MFYLSKILPLLVLPVGITLLFMLAGLVLRRRGLLIAAFVMLWLSSLPIVARTLWGLVETGERINAEQAPKADAIVVLSSGRVVAPGAAKISEWGDADRFFGGVQLFQAGKAPLLVFTGGWTPLNPTAPLEGTVLVDYARQFGVPKDAVLTTKAVANTAEEALAVGELLRAGFPAPRILLVTSAFHMPRAAHLFSNAGMEVMPFPVDFSDAATGIGVLAFLPNARAVATTQAALREIYGRLYYGLRPL